LPTPAGLPFALPGVPAPVGLGLLLGFAAPFGLPVSGFPVLAGFPKVEGLLLLALLSIFTGFLTALAGATSFICGPLLTEGNSDPTFGTFDLSSCAFAKCEVVVKININNNNLMNNYFLKIKLFFKK
jgi:hypothetical protein